MQYTVACNWDPGLLDRIDYPDVVSVFAGLPNTAIGSGRSSILIRDLDEAGVRDYIRRVHAKGWSFDYNVNAMCLGNKDRRYVHYSPRRSGALQAQSRAEPDRGRFAASPIAGCHWHSASFLFKRA